MEKRPVILVVMDGIGIREDKKNNAVALANKPTLDKLWAECPHTQLRAHGLAYIFFSILSIILEMAEKLRSVEWYST